MDWVELPYPLPLDYETWVIIEQLPQKIPDYELWHLLDVERDREVLQKKTITYSSDRLYKTAVIVYKSRIAASSALTALTQQFRFSPFCALKASDIFRFIRREEESHRRAGRPLVKNRSIVLYRINGSIEHYYHLFTAFGDFDPYDPGKSFRYTHTVDAMAAVWGMDNQRYGDVVIRAERPFYSASCIVRSELPIIKLMRRHNLLSNPSIQRYNQWLSNEISLSLYGIDFPPTGFQMHRDQHNRFDEDELTSCDFQDLDSNAAGMAAAQALPVRHESLYPSHHEREVLEEMGAYAIEPIPFDFPQNPRRNIGAQQDRIPAPNMHFSTLGYSDEDLYSNYYEPADQEESFDSKSYRSSSRDGARSPPSPSKIPRRDRRRLRRSLSESGATENLMKACECFSPKKDVGKAKEEERKEINVDKGMNGGMGGVASPVDIPQKAPQETGARPKIHRQSVNNNNNNNKFA